MSRIGGPNEIAALSIGMTVDQTALDASLAQAKQKVEVFNRTTTIAPTVIGPMTGGTPAAMPKPGSGGAYNLDVTSGFFPGAGKGQTYGIDAGAIPVLDETKDKIDKLDKAHKTLGQTMRDQVKGQRDFISGMKQQIGVVTSLISSFAAVTGVAYAFFSIGQKIGEMLTDSAGAAREFSRAIEDSAESVNKFNAARQKAVDKKLSRAGLTEDDKAMLGAAAAKSVSREEAAQTAVLEQESSGFYQASTMGLGALLGPIGGGVNLYQSMTNASLKRDVESASVTREERSRQISGVAQRGAAPTVATSTDTLADAMRRTADSNVRMQRGEHAVNRDNYSKSLTEPARMAR